MRKNEYDEYMTKIQKASADCWKCFTVSRDNKQHMQKMFSMVSLKYKNRESVLCKYVDQYLDALKRVLNANDQSMDNIREASKRIWNIFKKYIKCIYDMNIEDAGVFFDSIINEFISIDDEGWSYDIKQYARQYICACVDEIDREYRRINEIRESQV